VGTEASLAADANETAETEPLQDRLDAALQHGLQRRELASPRNGAWQILHGVLAYGMAAQMETPEGRVAVVPYLLDGGTVDGFDPLPADRFENPATQGLRLELEPGSKTGQGHRDQWLAILSQCDLPADQTIRVGGEDFTILDMVRQTEWDIPRNLEREYSWTLIGLTAYRPTTYRWTARDGQSSSIEGLVESELNRALESSACGGTHRLIGLAMALQRHRAGGGRDTGVWKAVATRVDAALEAARQHQNRDGSFSSHYVHRPGWTADLSETLGTTGHTLEFVALAGEPSLLQEAWVEQAAHRLCDVLALTEEIELECGGLYHALHGLHVYRQRRFGDVSFPVAGQ
jgi:hypothetical protein